MAMAMASPREVQQAASSHLIDLLVSRKGVHGEERRLSSSPRSIFTSHPAPTRVRSRSSLPSPPCSA